MNLGGKGGTGNSAGNVTVTNSAKISTGKILNEKVYGNNSYGIYAQSVGGGGGAGGNVLNVQASNGANLAVSLGGEGGEGGVAKNVTVTNTGAITTLGGQSSAIFAQSLGGKGGSGGQSVSVQLAANKGQAISAGASVGGNGGSGANAGDVSVTNSAPLSTVGDFSYGIFAQSVGGGGGAGGNSTNAQFTGSSDGSSYNLGINVGGKGAGGGKAANVNVTNTAPSIITLGNYSTGIFAQSVGGGGGDGGSTLNMQLTGSIGDKDKSNTITGGLNIGGTGGSGNSGGNVELYSSSDILTMGDFAYGIIAQSVGGGGGTGGSSISYQGTLTIGTDPDNLFQGKSRPLTLGGNIAGAGGNGGKAGNVTATPSGTINTFGDSASGFLAQSVGGGGGAGGSITSYNFTSNNIIKLSGSLAKLATEGTTCGSGTESCGSYYNDTVNLGYNAWTAEDTTAEKEAPKSPSLMGSVNVGFGGKGGTGGIAGNVEVLSDPNGNPLKINTHGNLAIGFVAQSVGGGGGYGGSTSNTSVNTVASTISFGAAAQKGGEGGTAGNSGNVTIGQVSDPLEVYISTFGDSATGFLAQAVGGGGGAGGASENNNNGGAMNLGFSMGAKGGAGGDSKSVTVNAKGTISTSGNNATGLIAQSVGGGGGTGGSAISSTSASAPSANQFDYSGSRSPMGTLKGGTESWVKQKNMALGAGVSDAGEGGGGGNSGDVNVDFSGTITTSGNSSDGIFIQSIGGGGGVAGISNSESSTSGGGSVTGAVAIGLGGTGGGGGNGGNVTLTTNTGAIDVSTSGVASKGIVLQSVGGGGGRAGAVKTITTEGTDAKFNLGSALADAGSGGSGGNSGNVKLGNDNNLSVINVTTTGDNSTGIFLQSIGGGGGIGDDTTTGQATGVLDVSALYGSQGGNGGDGGNIEIYSDVNVVTTGDSSYGITLQSVGGGGGQAGSVKTTSSDGKGGPDNTNPRDVFTKMGTYTSPAGFISSVAKLTFGGSYGKADEGGGGGSAGNIAGVLKGSIITTGNNSIGLTAQSIGGGGGIGGTVTESAADSSTGSIGYANMTNISMGGDGGNGGNSGSINFITQDKLTIKTSGSASHGMLLQSIGGGGGSGGAVIGANIKSATANSTFAFGSTVNSISSENGSFGSGGSGGSITFGTINNLADLSVSTLGPILLEFSFNQSEEVVDREQQLLIARLEAI